MPNPVPYQEALTRLHKAEADVSRYVALIIEAGNKFAENRWKEVILSSCNTFTISSSFGLKMGRSPSINMELWPTADQLGTALTEYHKAKQAIPQ